MYSFMFFDFLFVFRMRSTVQTLFFSLDFLFDKAFQFAGPSDSPENSCCFVTRVRLCTVRGLPVGGLRQALRLI